MNTAIAYTGYIKIDELKEKADYPSPARFQKGPVAIIECLQEIPCDPCRSACPFGAIKIENDLTNLPYLDNASCKGCKVCIANCPGQAIFVVDYSYSATEGTVTFPYEYLPLPLEGMEVIGVNRTGKEVCLVKILKVESKNSYKKTSLITVGVPHEFMEEVRFIKYRRDGGLDE